MEYREYSTAKAIKKNWVNKEKLKGGEEESKDPIFFSIPNFPTNFDNSWLP